MKPKLDYLKLPEKHARALSPARASTLAKLRRLAREAAGIKNPAPTRTVTGRAQKLHPTKGWRYV